MVAVCPFGLLIPPAPRVRRRMHDAARRRMQDTIFAMILEHFRRNGCSEDEISQMIANRDEEEKEKNKCCFCGIEFEGYGNNPSPLLAQGVACDECNVKIVMPHRFKKFARPRSEEEES